MTMESSSEASQLQFTYLSVFLLGSGMRLIFCLTIYIWYFIIAADNLKGPYLYALYDSYHIPHQTIELLYVIANISSLCVGTFVASFADTW